MTIRTLRELERATMRLWNSRRAYLKYPPHGFDCEGEYWILRNTTVIKAWRKACTDHAATKKTDKS